MILLKKWLIAVAVIVLVAMTAVSGYCEIKYINGYTRSDGTSVRGHYRDTSNDGNQYNNANYLGYN